MILFLQLILCFNFFSRYFHKFLQVTQEPLNIFKIGLFQTKERIKTYQKKYSFNLKNVFYKV